MARLLGPDSRLAFIPTSTVLGSAIGLTGIAYASATGTALADILEYDGTAVPGSALPGSAVTVDTNSLIPLFWFPDDVDEVFIEFPNGSRLSACARYDSRLDALEASMSTCGNSVTATTSLTDATSGTGTVVDFGCAVSNVSLMIVTNGTILAGVVTLDVSQNGSDWVAQASSTALATSANQKISATGLAVRYARARISTAITGGGSVTCTLMETS